MYIYIYVYIYIYICIYIYIYIYVGWSLHTYVLCSQVPRVSVRALPPVSSAVEGLWPENLDHDGFHWTGPRENLKETMCFSHEIWINHIYIYDNIGCFFQNLPLNQSISTLGYFNDPWFWRDGRTNHYRVENPIWSAQFTIIRTSSPRR